MCMYILSFQYVNCFCTPWLFQMWNQITQPWWFPGYGRWNAVNWSCLIIAIPTSIFYLFMLFLGWLCSHFCPTIDCDSMWFWYLLQVEWLTLSNICCLAHVVRWGVAAGATRSAGRISPTISPVDGCFWWVNIGIDPTRFGIQLFRMGCFQHLKSAESSNIFDLTLQKKILGWCAWVNEPLEDKPGFFLKLRSCNTDFSQFQQP